VANAHARMAAAFPFAPECDLLGCNCEGSRGFAQRCILCLSIRDPMCSDRPPMRWFAETVPS
jgi:hypothetical protein